MSAHKKGSKTAGPVASFGLRIDDVRQLRDRTRAVLQSALNVPFTRHVVIGNGRRELCYFTEAKTISVPGTERNMPALPLQAGPLENVWLVVELELDNGAPATLLQANLKIHQGPTTEAATLRFRAEWDMRDPGSPHAQPHWNIHAPSELNGLATALPHTFDKFIGDIKENFATFATQQELGSATIAPMAAVGFSAIHMHRFHFAMCEDWPMKNVVRRPPAENVDQVVNWIAGCTAYLRSQFHFIMSI